MEQNYINEKIQFFNKICSKDVFVQPAFNLIFKFLDRDSRKCLYLCNKKIYEKYCDQVKELKIKKGTEISIVLALMNNYKNVENLDLSGCQNIKDFTPISKIEGLEILDVGSTNISDISF